MTQTAQLRKSTRTALSASDVTLRDAARRAGLPYFGIQKQITGQRRVHPADLTKLMAAITELESERASR